MIFISCSKEGDEESNQSESISPVEIETIAITPDFDNDSIYSAAKPKILNSYWTAFVKSAALYDVCLLYTSPSPRDGLLSRMPSSA